LTTLHQAQTPLDATHGVICSFPHDFYGYFGWPTVARLDDGTLVVAASGLRNAHVCPFGRTVICTSSDERRTWTAPAVVNDLPIDDRDAGVLSLGDRRLLISWFSTDTRKADIHRTYREREDAGWIARYRAGFARMNDDTAARWVGSWVRLSADAGETWDAPVKVPVTAPHGPIRLANGALLYLGKTFTADERGNRTRDGQIRALQSTDGTNWSELGTVSLPEGTIEEQYHEPHVVELPTGGLLGLIRLQNHASAPPLEDRGWAGFGLALTRSLDGGKTWTEAEPLGFHGSPPHLIRHSSRALVCVYGYRLAPFGQRAMISVDEGASWRYDLVIRDDGPDSDLGYPSSAELEDGSILTVYYQKLGDKREKCSLLWSRWKLPR